MSMLPGWPGEPVTRIRPADTPDPYSGEVVDVDWGASTELLLTAAAVAPAGSSEPVLDGREPVLTQTVVYLPGQADVLAGDRMLVRGEVYAVVGDPSLWVDPWQQSPSGLVVRLSKVEG